MSDDLTRLLDLPALARLSVAGDEIALLTLTHEHADKVSIERRKLGTSIDLGDLLQLIGAHGLAELPASQIQVSEIQPAQLPAPAETAPLPTTRRTTKHHTPPVVSAPETPKQLAAHTKATATLDRVSCSQCNKDFDPRGLGPHMAKVHKAAVASEPPVAAETYACPECPRTFRSQNALDSHVAMIHWQNEAVAPVVLIEGICDVCRRPEGLHDRCVDCGMLLGDKHTAGPVHIRINGKPLCASCDAYRTTASRLVRTS